MAKGLRSNRGAIAAAPFTNGPYTWDQHVNFTGGVSFGEDGKGNAWYVSSASGSNSYDGKSWSSPLLTIQAAVTAASAGDTIYLQGTFTEAVTCSTSSLSFIGAGPTVNDNVWMESAPGQTLLTLTGKNCKFYNIRFRIPTTGGIGINMAASDYTIIAGCHFQGRTNSYYAIYNNGGSQCQILGNVFEYMNTGSYGTAILGYTYTAIPTGWEIAYNIFHRNLKHISMTMRQSFVHDNLFQAVGLSSSNGSLSATVLCDIYTGSAGNGQYNTVTRNMMMGTYSISGGYKGQSSDSWYGNKCEGISATGVTAEGTTTAIPA